MSCSSPWPRGEGYALQAGQLRAVNPMGGELAEGVLPGWGRIAPRAGAGCCGERGSQGSWRRWGQTLDFALAQARVAGRVGIDKGLVHEIEAGVGQAAAGSLHCLPPRSAGASRCLEPRAAAGAEIELESRAASSRLRTTPAQSPSCPRRLRPSSWQCLPPLRCFAGSPV